MPGNVFAGVPADDRGTAPRGLASDAHALVVGGGIAGLLSARVLAEYFKTVTVIERDALGDKAGPRPGTPQATHLHLLQAGGLQALVALFPNFQTDLEEAGAIKIRIGLDFRDEIPGSDPLPKRDLGMNSYTMTRPLLEHLIRQRVRSLPNVTIRDRSRVLRLLAKRSREVSGVLLESPTRETKSLDANLVVDATGRGNLTTNLLREMGLPLPAEAKIGMDMGYATAVFAMPSRIPSDWKGLAVRPVPPHYPRGAILVPIEDSRWMLSIAGVQDDQPPGDEAGFWTFVQGLPTSTLRDALHGAVRLGEIQRYRLPESIWRRYDAMADFPQGLLPIADAVCRFNPIYGQGMTVAAKQALVLADVLRERVGRSDPLHDINQAFQTATFSLIDAAWSAAAVPDFAFPLTTGERPAGLGDRMQFNAAAFRAAFHDPEIHRLLFEVRHMLKLPGALRSPAIESRIMAHLTAR